MRQKYGGERVRVDTSPIDAADVYPLHQFVGDFANWVSGGHDIRYCFVLGAGASRSSGIPTGAALVDEWLQTRFAQECPGAANDQLRPWTEEMLKWDGFSWAIRSAFYGRLYEWFYRDNATGQAALRRLMRGKSPSFGYSVLANMLLTTPHRVVLTTNFDNLVRDAIGLYAPACDPFICHGENDARFLAGHADRVRVVKLHGDIDRETYNAASQLERLHDEWETALRGIFTDHTPIFLGYGGNDPGLMRFLSENLVERQFRARPIWAYRVEVTQTASGWRAGAVPPGYPETPLVRRFMNRHRGLWLPTPGFDELMLLLGHTLKYGSQAVRIRGEADRRAQDYERTLVDAVKAVRSVPAAKWCPQLEHLASSAEAQLLGAGGPRTLNEWRVALRAAPSREKEAELFSQALLELGGSPALLADYARFLAEEDPKRPDVEEMIARADELAQNTTGAQSPAALAVKHSLAVIRLSQGRLDEALSIGQELLPVRAMVLGREHPETLRTATLVAAVLLDKGQFPAAERLFRETVTINERTLGPEHSDTLWSLNNLANTLSKLDRYDEAEALLRRVVGVRERVLSRDHRTTLTSISNLGNVLRHKGEHQEAEALLREVLEGYGRTLGRRHPDTLAAAVNLGLALEEQGPSAEGRQLIEHAAQTLEETLGPDHPTTQWATKELKGLG